MRKIVLAVAVIFVLAVLVPQYSFAKEYKIAYVDLAKVFDEYSKTKEADKALEEIEKVVTDYSKQEGYDVIFNSRMLLYGNETMDLTPEILKRLNK